MEYNHYTLISSRNGLMIIFLINGHFPSQENRVK